MDLESGNNNSHEKLILRYDIKKWFLPYMMNVAKSDIEPVRVYLIWIMNKTEGTDLYEVVKKPELDVRVGKSKIAIFEKFNESDRSNRKWVETENDFNFLSKKFRTIREFDKV